MTDATSSTAARRLTRSSDDHYVAGVCGGLAAYTGIDANLLRVALLVLTCLGGAGIAAYLIAWLLVPADDQDESWAEGLVRKLRRNR